MAEDVLSFIRSCRQLRRILWTYHVNMRLQQRAISRDIILKAFNTFEIIEHYPDDKYFPSCLVYAEFEKSVFHIQIAVDREGDTIRIITAYKPTFEKWENDYKTRRHS